MRDEWHRVMSRSYNNGIKVFGPPPILLPILKGPSESENPFPRLLILLNQFDSCVVRNEILVPVPVQQVLKVPFHGRPMPEGRIFSMSPDIQRRPLVWERLLGKRHCKCINVRFKRWVDGRLGKAVLGVARRCCGQRRRDWQRLIWVTRCYLLEVWILLDMVLWVRDPAKALSSCTKKVFWRGETDQHPPAFSLRSKTLMVSNSLS